MSITAWVMIGGAVVLIVVLMYNGLVGKKNQVENAFASIDTLLKKRYHSTTRSAGRWGVS